jgi:4-diphosphocytidyl-2-C-methyl-D-erythritol kinase
MVTFPNAKINIGLQITEKRPDGFHNLLSCFYPVGWSDVLEILPAETLSFRSTGIPIPGDTSGNLCLRAYESLKRDFDIPPVMIHLHKVVPIGAGLGGGSADCAFALKTFNTLFELNLSVSELQNYARPLGSDCAFFIENTPKFCVEKGDIFEEINLSLATKHIVLVNPNIHISTKEAYSGVKPQKPVVSLKEVLENAPLNQWKDLIKNDFEDGLLPKYPAIAQVKSDLYALGATYASMTGSGSTVFGIFEEEISQQIINQQFSSLSTWQGKL